MPENVIFTFSDCAITKDLYFLTKDNFVSTKDEELARKAWTADWLCIQ